MELNYKKILKDSQAYPPVFDADYILACAICLLEQQDLEVLERKAGTMLIEAMKKYENKG